MSASPAFTSSELAAVVKAVMLPITYLIGNVARSGPQKLAAELAAAQKIIADLARTRFKGNTVIQALAAGIKDAKATRGENVVNMPPDQFVAKLKAALSIVDGKASPVEARGYREFIYLVTTGVAEAQAEGVLGLGDKVSAAERKYLDSLKKLLDAAPASKTQTTAAAAVAKAAADAKAKIEAARAAAARAAASAKAKPAATTAPGVARGMAGRAGAPVSAKPSAGATTAGDELADMRADAAAARAAAAKAAAEPEGETYVVKKGDTLSAIAKQYLGKANLYMKIFEATNERAKADKSFATIKDPNLIHIGWKLCIPKM